MAIKHLPSPSELRQLLNYDAEAGGLTWLKRPRELFRLERDWKRWNTCFAGKVAGTKMSTGYLVFRCFDTLIYAHRAAWAIVNGEWPTDDIDHINGMRDDNRLENLRSVPHVLNQRNLRLPPNTGTGVVGVYRMRNGKYRAIIGSRGNTIHLGYFESISEGQEARSRAEADLGYHVNHGKPGNG